MEHTASAYGYATVADIEAVDGRDLSALDARYTDTVVEAWISSAERAVNAWCDTSFTGTIPDGVKGATIAMTWRIVNNKLVTDGHLPQQAYIPYITLPKSDMEAFLGPQVPVSSRSNRYHWMVSS